MYKKNREKDQQCNKLNSEPPETKFLYLLLKTNEELNNNNKKKKSPELKFTELKIEFIELMIQGEFSLKQQLCSGYK